MPSMVIMCALWSGVFPLLTPYYFLTIHPVVFTFSQRSLLARMLHHAVYALFIRFIYRIHMFTGELSNPPVVSPVYRAFTRVVIPVHLFSYVSWL